MIDVPVAPHKMEVEAAKDSRVTQNAVVPADRAAQVPADHVDPVDPDRMAPKADHRLAHMADQWVADLWADPDRVCRTHRRRDSSRCST